MLKLTSISSDRKPSVALLALTKAAESGNLEANLRLGRYYSGHGKWRGIDDRDYKKAAAHYRQAAFLGSDKAANNLGLMFLTGQGSKPNLRMAEDFLSLASAHGNANSMTIIAVMASYDGREMIAQSMIRRASHLGYEPAMRIGEIIAQRPEISVFEARKIDCKNQNVPQADITIPPDLLRRGSPSRGQPAPG